jgi:hypothetical protein
MSFNGGGGARKGEWRPKERIVLEAIVNADCARCGAHGHTTSDCLAPAGARYDLADEVPEGIPDVVARHGGPPAGSSAAPVSKKSAVSSIEEALQILEAAKKKKKEKKKKKKEKKALKKLKKKLKKEKKAKNSQKEAKVVKESSDSDSSSDED